MKNKKNEICYVCNDKIGTRKIYSVPFCTHIIHRDCFWIYVNKSFGCGICNKKIIWKDEIDFYVKKHEEEMNLFENKP